MFFVNQLSGSSLMSLFSTHPPLEERIARLRGQRYGGGGGAVAEPTAGPDQQAQAMWKRLSGK
jgi:heat shock protein HtpX